MNTIDKAQNDIWTYDDHLRGTCGYELRVDGPTELRLEVLVYSRGEMKQRLETSTVTADADSMVAVVADTDDAERIRICLGVQPSGARNITSSAIMYIDDEEIVNSPERFIVNAQAGGVLHNSQETPLIYVLLDDPKESPSFDSLDGALYEHCLALNVVASAVPSSSGWESGLAG